jgi:hypothetical protein
MDGSEERGEESGPVVRRGMARRGTRGRWGGWMRDKINAVNSGSDNCTGMGIVSGFLAAMLIRCGPHVKHVDPSGRIRFLPILQEGRPVCKNSQPVLPKTSVFRTLH